MINDVPAFTQVANVKFEIVGVAAPVPRIKIRVEFGSNVAEM